MTLEVGPKSSCRGDECQCHLFYHLVVFLGVMKHPIGEIDRELLQRLLGFLSNL